MEPSEPGDITQLLIAWSNGDRDALDRVTPLVYDELRGIARSKLRQHGSDAMLQPTVLVHEAYVKLIDEKRVKWQNRAHFYAIAANTMRRIIIDEYRQRGAGKRGGGLTFVSPKEGEAIANTWSVDVFALNEALEKLTRLDERQARLIEMRFFGGMDNNEIAAALEISLPL
jgi:RNA polymerase sigma-70 factor, ECF subfamily